MRVYVLNSALPRTPLARFAAGVAVLLLLAGLFLVVLPLAGLALLLALAGAVLIAVARWVWRLGATPSAQGDGTTAASAPRRYDARRSQDVIDVEVLPARRTPD